jgi:hypothetical protein
MSTNTAPGSKGFVVHFFAVIAVRASSSLKNTKNKEIE